MLNIEEINLDDLLCREKQAPKKIEDTKDQYSDWPEVYRRHMNKGGIMRSETSLCLQYS